MFYRYGFFSLSVRVVPRDDPGKWLVREPTANIFDQQSLVIEDKAGPNTFARQPVQVSIFMTLSTVKISIKLRFSIEPSLKFLSSVDHANTIVLSEPSIFTGIIM